MASTNDPCANDDASAKASRLPLPSKGLAITAPRQTIPDRGKSPPGIEAARDWFRLDPIPRFIVNSDGYLISANPAGEAALQDGKLAATSAGALKFGSADCDGRFLAAVRQVAGRSASGRVVLRQRHGGWFAVEIHGALGGRLAVFGLTEELAPSLEAIGAIGAAFQLTAPELGVLHALLAGRCPKTAAMDLHISEHTVRAHLRSIYAKMNVRGLSNTIKFACSFL